MAPRRCRARGPSLEPSSGELPVALLVLGRKRRPIAREAHPTCEYRQACGTRDIRVGASDANAGSEADSYQAENLRGGRRGPFQPRPVAAVDGYARWSTPCPKARMRSHDPARPSATFPDIGTPGAGTSLPWCTGLAPASLRSAHALVRQPRMAQRSPARCESHAAARGRPRGHPRRRTSRAATRRHAGHLRRRPHGRTRARDAQRRHAARAPCRARSLR